MLCSSMCTKQKKIAIDLYYYKATSNSKFYTIHSYYENRIFEACNYLQKGVSKRNINILYMCSELPTNYEFVGFKFVYFLKVLTKF